MVLCLLDSGGDENFVTYDSVFGALKIDLFLSFVDACFCFGKKIKIIF